MMGNMDPWDVALLAVAGYVAVVSLVRLMLQRRDHLLGELRRAVRNQQHRTREAPRRPRQEEAA